MDTLPRSPSVPSAEALQRVANTVRASLGVPAGVAWCLGEARLRFAHDGLDQPRGLTSAQVRTMVPALEHPVRSPIEVEGTAYWVLATSPVHLDGRVVGGVAALDSERRLLTAGERRLLDRCGQVLVEQTTSDDAFETIAARVVELERQGRELRAVNRELERFVYGASHDLQEPLRTVKSFIDLLSEDHATGLDATGRQYLDLAQSGAHRLQALFGGVLRYARSHQFEDELAELSLDELLDDVLTDLQPRLEAHDATVQREPLPVAEVAPAPMYQVFENLIGNALKYTPPSKPAALMVFFDGIVAEGPDGGAMHRIVFADAGPGIPDGMHARIFEPFVRGGDRTVDGLGFGLSIARRIVERHGGRLVSEPSETGARFVLTLPATGTSRDDGGSDAADR